MASAAEDVSVAPRVVRKMNIDNSQKFFHHYAAFNLEQSLASRTKLESAVSDNATVQVPFTPAYAPHRQATLTGNDDPARSWDLFRRAQDALQRLQKRQFTCPSGTSDCRSIGRPYSCCANGLQCTNIQDTGLGPVGCCPPGEACGGAISCPGSQLGCPSNVGGGCCINGFVCASIGCVQVQTSTVIAPQPTTSSTQPLTTTTITPSTSIVLTTSSPSTTSSATPTTVATTSSTSSSAPVAPVRPTATTTSQGSGLPGYCPTGFYACVASAGGGCCQTGRDCATYSCPPVASTTIITSAPTVVVPASGVPTSMTGSCAGGWTTCPADAGSLPGCCPSGYACGTASCSLVVAGATATVAKEMPSAATANDALIGLQWGVLILAAILLTIPCT